MTKQRKGDRRVGGDVCGGVGSGVEREGGGAGRGRRVRREARGAERLEGQGMRCPEPCSLIRRLAARRPWRTEAQAERWERKEGHA